MLFDDHWVKGTYKETNSLALLGIISENKARLKP